MNFLNKKVLVLIVMLFIVASSYAQVLDKTIAIVTLYKTENVSKKNFEEKLSLWAKQTEQSITTEIKESVLTATINDILISQAADKAGIVATNQQIDQMIEQQKQSLGTPISDDDLKAFIEKNSGLSWNEYRDQVRNRIIQEQYIFKKYKNQLENVNAPTESEIKDTYDLYATQFTNPAMVRIDHLFWDARDKSKDKATLKTNAEATARTINNSSSKFDEYKTKSLDDPSFDGGDMGYVIRDDSTFKILGTAFLEKAFSMKINDVSGVLESSLGYHIIKITDKRGAKLLQLDDPVFPGEKNTVRDRVKSLLINQKQQEQFIKLVKEEVDILRKDAKIKILSKNY